MKWGEEGREEGEDDYSSVVRGGAQADADVLDIEEGKRDCDDKSGKGGTRDVVEDIEAGGM